MEVKGTGVISVPAGERGSAPLVEVLPPVVAQLWHPDARHMPCTVSTCATTAHAPGPRGQYRDRGITANCLRPAALPVVRNIAASDEGIRASRVTDLSGYAYDGTGEGQLEPDLFL